MKKILLSVLLLVGMATPAFALDLTWSPNAEPDMSLYNVYMCKTKDCTATPSGALWVGSVPHVFVNPPARYKFSIPANLEGSAVITAEDTAKNNSSASNMVSFSTVPNLPPAAPLDLRVQ